mmetsp:Transcript_18614/g.25809  ORF Transcript_18614/g.25809 Transcript_18614/m.25809 type:complete len:258 (+) Transcript_18614:94-867(+)|eukprot:CAMPEP_0196579628 /NCGR_PEP_ID=MMETSP1081-20130531/23721_1 /TAXON_ID=36882 /ORGANISM="Pyramimonas amylifera, Strain CCMP720" /LENGTH=257 /DNA_ID=CAMNT_0041899265 /DNA_START=90 /DNA_END=863 /DNA_ORIENTATION=+
MSEKSELKTKYVGTLNVGTSVLTSRAEVKLENSGKAFLEFKQGEPGKGKIGITDVLMFDNKVKTSGWYSATDKKGQLDLTGDVTKDMNLLVSAPLPLPQDLTQVPCKLTVKRKLKIADAKLMLFSKEKKAQLELMKKLDHDIFSKGTLTLDSAKQSGTLKLETKKFDQMDMKHMLTMGITANVNDTSKPTSTVLYKCEVSGDLNVNAQLDYPPIKGHMTKVSAEYNMGEVKATASCFVDSMQAFSEPNLELKSIFEF